MFRRLIAAGCACLLFLLVAAMTADEKVTLAVPGIQCPRCIESLTVALGRVDPSVKVTGVVETKRLEVSYDPSRVSLHQVVGAVSEAQPMHNKQYEGGVVVTVEDAAKNAAKVKKALGQVKGVANFIALPGGESGDIMVILRPLPRTAKPSEYVKASQIGEALDKNGVKYSGVPGGSAGFGDDLDAKKKPASTKTPAKSKAEEMPLEKTKPVRPAPTVTKSRPPREPATPPAQGKDKEADEDKPRFVILAGDSDKVYLVDHEAKSDDGKELKKLVKEGDKFGEYLVKEVGDDDGLYVVLEHAVSKDTVRIEHKKKEKEGEKPKEHSDSKAKETTEKEKKDDK